MHSANPPGPLSKQNGTSPRAPSGNWRCKKRAVAASNKGVTWAIFSLTPSGLWAQTPLLIPGASPGKPVTWQTQLLPFTEDQDLPAAKLPALHCSDPQVSPTPCSILQYKALLTALALKATYSDLQELCCVKEKRQHQTWCQGLIRTRPLEIPMTQTQLDSPRPSTPFSPDFLLLQQNLQLNVSSCHVSQPRKAKQLGI